MAKAGSKGARPAGKTLQDYVLEQIKSKRLAGIELSEDERGWEAKLLNRVSLNKRVVQELREPSTEAARQGGERLVAALTAFLREIAPESRSGAPLVFRGAVSRTGAGPGEFDFVPRVTGGPRQTKRGVDMPRDRPGT